MNNWLTVKVINGNRVNKDKQDNRNRLQEKFGHICSTKQYRQSQTRYPEWKTKEIFINKNKNRCI